MAFLPDKIHAGPARIFVGVTNPATGTPPTFITHTLGIPTDGTSVGLTDGDTTFSYNPKKAIIGAEQYYSGVATFLTDEDADVKLTMKESTLASLNVAFSGTGNGSGGGKDYFYFGAGSGAYAVTTQSVFISARQRVDPTKYICILLYKAFSQEPLKYTFGRKKESMWSVTLQGLADVSRNDGDAIGQMFVETT